MGMYSETIECDLSYKYVFMTGKSHGLPVPRATDDHAVYFNCNDVKAWEAYLDERMYRESEIDRNVYYITLLLRTHALNYINKVSREAPEGPPRKRLKYFQRASKKYRLTFF